MKSERPGSIRSGENARKEVPPHPQIGRLQNRLNQFLRRPRIGGGLKNHQRSGLQMLTDRFAGTNQVAEIGSRVFPRGVGTQMMTASHSPIFS